MHRRDRAWLNIEAQKKCTHYIDVIRNCSRLINLKREEKEFIVYYNVRGVAYARTHNYKKAISDFDTGIELLCKEEKFDRLLAERFLFNRALTFMMSLDYKKVIQELTKLLEFSEEQSYVYYFLGVVNFVQANKKDALIYFLCALTVDSGKQEQDKNEFENEENDVELEVRCIDFKKLKCYLGSYKIIEIYNYIISLPYEQSTVLLKQCKDPTTFLGGLCKACGVKELSEVDSVINYLTLMKMGILGIFPPAPAPLSLEKPQDNEDKNTHRIRKVSGSLSLSE